MRSGPRCRAQPTGVRMGEAESRASGSLGGDSRGRAGPADPTSGMSASPIGQGFPFKEAPDLIPEALLCSWKL